MRAQIRKTWMDGVWAGVIGYAAVIVVVTLMNVLAGRSPFYTAALLGSALFYHLHEPAALVIAPGPVLAFNMLHMVLFLALGQLCAWLIRVAERYPTAQYPVLVLLLLVGLHVSFAVAFLTRPLLGELAWWQVGASSFAAAAAIAWYLFAAHPFLRRELREIPMGEVPTGLRP